MNLLCIQSWVGQVKLAKMKHLIFLIFCFFMEGAVSSSDIIDSRLQKRFIFGGDETQNVMVSFSDGIQKVFERFSHLNFSRIAERRDALTKAQQSFASLIQAPLQRFLKTMGIKFESFWINNKMVVPNVNSRIVRMIARIPGILKIEEEPIVEINPLDVGEPEEIDFESHDRLTRQTNLEWGIKKIRANEVWSSYKGKGIVVAGIDTGVRYTHEALRKNWRRDYGWLDPYKNTTLPNDQNGHGTHTIGTIAGTNGIGVAPEATWIACKGCDAKTCKSAALFACGQWVQCPTRPDGTGRDCSKAPHIVSNSWGSSGGSKWYDDVIESWHAAGIIPIFSNGNRGPNCNTAGSPGDRARVISVGNTDINDRIARSSSLGPNPDGRVKPDVSAPGSNIRSAWHTGDTTYNSISGTSMACPHVSGLVALLLQKNKNLSYRQVYDSVAIGAERRKLDTSTAKTCGNKTVSSYPNNVFGYGRIDAVNALARV